MSLRLVPKSVTLNGLERRNSPNRRVISPLNGWICLYSVLDYAAPIVGFQTHFKSLHFHSFIARYGVYYGRMFIDWPKCIRCIAI